MRENEFLDDQRGVELKRLVLAFSGVQPAGKTHRRVCITSRFIAHIQ